MVAWSQYLPRTSVPWILMVPIATQISEQGRESERKRKQEKQGRRTNVAGVLADKIARRMKRERAKKLERKERKRKSRSALDSDCVRSLGTLSTTNTTVASSLNETSGWKIQRLDEKQTPLVKKKVDVQLGLDVGESERNELGSPVEATASLTETVDVKAEAVVAAASYNSGSLDHVDDSDDLLAKFLTAAATGSGTVVSESCEDHVTLSEQNDELQLKLDELFEIASAFETANLPLAEPITPTSTMHNEAVRAQMGREEQMPLPEQNKDVQLKLEELFEIASAFETANLPLGNDEPKPENVDLCSTLTTTPTSTLHETANDEAVRAELRQMTPSEQSTDLQLKPDEVFELASAFETANFPLGKVEPKAESVDLCATLTTTPTSTLPELANDAEGAEIRREEKTTPPEQTTDLQLTQHELGDVASAFQSIDSLNEAMDSGSLFAKLFAMTPSDASYETDTETVGADVRSLGEELMTETVQEDEFQWTMDGVENERYDLASADDSTTASFVEMEPSADPFTELIPTPTIASLETSEDTAGLDIQRYGKQLMIPPEQKNDLQLMLDDNPGISLTELPSIYHATDLERRSTGLDLRTFDAPAFPSQNTNVPSETSMAQCQLMPLGGTNFACSYQYWGQNVPPTFNSSQHKPNTSNNSVALIGDTATDRGNRTTYEPDDQFVRDYSPPRRDALTESLVVLPMTLDRWNGDVSFSTSAATAPSLPDQTMLCASPHHPFIWSDDITELRESTTPAVASLQEAEVISDAISASHGSDTLLAELATVIEERNMISAELKDKLDAFTCVQSSIGDLTNSIASLETVQDTVGSEIRRLSKKQILVTAETDDLLVTLDGEESDRENLAIEDETTATSKELELSTVSTAVVSHSRALDADSTDLLTKLATVNQERDAVSTKLKDKLETFTCVQSKIETLVTKIATLENDCGAAGAEIRRLGEEQTALTEEENHLHLVLNALERERYSLASAVETATPRTTALLQEAEFVPATMAASYNTTGLLEEFATLIEERNRLATQLKDRLDELMRAHAKIEELEIANENAGSFIERLCAERAALGEHKATLHSALEELRCNLQMELKRATTLFKSCNDERLSTIRLTSTESPPESESFHKVTIRGAETQGQESVDQADGSRTESRGTLFLVCSAVVSSCFGDVPRLGPRVAARQGRRRWLFSLLFVIILAAHSLVPKDIMVPPSTLSVATKNQSDAIHFSFPVVAKERFEEHVIKDSEMLSAHTGAFSAESITTKPSTDLKTCFWFPFKVFDLRQALAAGDTRRVACILEWSSHLIDQIDEDWDNSLSLAVQT